jgi:dTDP-4-amino-4,6-dideoxy-D-galactose acyltransferase
MSFNRIPTIRTPAEVHPRRAYRVEVSSLDEKRFGVKTAIARHFTALHWDHLRSFCLKSKVRFCIVRCAAEDLEAAHCLEENGFQWMDTLVYYGRPLSPRDGAPVPQPSVRIRAMRSSDKATIRRVAQQAFRNYSSHYHADLNLQRAACDALYADWAIREASTRKPGRAMLVAEIAGAVVGFLSLRLNQPKEGEGVLFAVSPRWQGRGVGLALMRQGAVWCSEQGARRMIISTQITNIAAQKTFIRAGFEPVRYISTFHKWFTTPLVRAGFTQ